MQQAETLRQDPAPALSPETSLAPLAAAATTERPPAQITYVPTEKRQKLERRLTLVVTILPFIGFAWALIWLWGRAVGWVDLGLFFALYCFTGFGITIGFHRMLTHRSFEAPRPVKILLAVAGSMAIQGPVVAWVADHRRHHAFTDKPGDPHSPHLEEKGGVLGVLRGLWHSHLGWFFSPERTNVSRFAPDMEKDRTMQIVSKLFPLWVVLSLLLPAAIGWGVRGTLTGALSGLLWGGAVRIFFLHHMTWSINSICHFYGKRPFDCGDYSTNNWVLSLLAFGEGWHNNHHAFPSSAIHGLGKWQIDFSGMVIRFMAKVRLARNLKIPTAEQVSMKTGTKSLAGPGRA